MGAPGDGYLSRPSVTGGSTTCELRSRVSPPRPGHGSGGTLSTRPHRQPVHYPSATRSRSGSIRRAVPRSFAGRPARQAGKPRGFGLVDPLADAVINSPRPTGRRRRRRAVPMAGAEPPLGRTVDAGLQAACAGAWVAFRILRCAPKVLGESLALAGTRWYRLAHVGTAAISGGSVCSVCARSVGCAARSSGWYALARPVSRWYPLAGKLSARALVAQGIEQRFPKPCVAGSIPAGGTSTTSQNAI
jgi:hypothetical protein